MQGHAFQPMDCKVIVSASLRRDNTMVDYTEFFMVCLLKVCVYRS